MAVHPKRETDPPGIERYTRRLPSALTTAMTASAPAETVNQASGSSGPEEEEGEEFLYKLFDDIGGDSLKIQGRSAELPR